MLIEKIKQIDEVKNIYDQFCVKDLGIYLEISGQLDSICRKVFDLYKNTIHYEKQVTCNKKTITKILH